MHTARTAVDPAGWPMQPEKPLWTKHECYRYLMYCNLYLTIVNSYMSSHIIVLNYQFGRSLECPCTVSVSLSVLISQSYAKVS